MFSELAGALTGPLTVWAIPMQPGGTTIGVITVYLRSGALAYDLDDAQFLADSVAAALLDDPSPHRLEPISGWSDRARVHQATGMIVAQLSVETEDALAILRAHAFAEGTTLGAIATEVVERRITFTPALNVTPIDTPPGDSMEGDEP